MAIYAYIGAKGSGKSAAAVQRCLRQRNAGFEIYSNLQSTWHWARPIRSLDDMLRCWNAIVLWDEAQNWVSARDYRNTPGQILSLFAQGRKTATHLVYTCQFPEQVDIQLRNQTDVWYRCDRIGPLIMVREFERLEQRRPGSTTWHYVSPALGRWYSTEELVSTRYVRRDGTEYYDGGGLGGGAERRRMLKRRAMLDAGAYRWQSVRGVDTLVRMRSEDEFAGVDRVLVARGGTLVEVEREEFAEVEMNGLRSAHASELVSLAGAVAASGVGHG